jgi:gas vesicle protein
MTSDQSSKVVLGFLIGAGVGAVVGLLLAPQSGKESQEWLAEQAKTGVKNLKTAGQFVKDNVQNVSVQGRKHVTAAVDAGKEAYSQIVGRGKEAYHDTVSNG